MIAVDEHVVGDGGGTQVYGISYVGNGLARMGNARWMMQEAGSDDISWFNRSSENERL